MTFETIDQIRAHQWVGCYPFDAEAFGALDRFLLDETQSVADRVEAFDRMGTDGMGVEPLDPNRAEADLALYLAELRQ